MRTVRLTVGEAIVRFLAAQTTEWEERRLPLFGGIWAIFGHGNVAGLGAALAQARTSLPTLRAHNEQAMALAAAAYARAHHRRRMMACTTSIGPGATNMVTAAAVAHVNRLPLLLLPGDVFADRAPDPVLQQVEDFSSPLTSANDCFRPVSRYFDRITRPPQLLASLPAALRVLTDPVQCGPATIALPQDVQAEVFDWPEHFFAPRLHRFRAPEPDVAELAAAARALRTAKRPLVIAGGGVKYGLACEALSAFALRRGLPVAETQAGKGSLAWDDSANVGSIGVTGSSAANALAAKADLVLAVGTRLADFTTGSRALFPQAQIIGLNAAPFDAAKQGALPLVADAGRGLAALDGALGRWKAPSPWTARAATLLRGWTRAVDRAVAAPRGSAPPSDAQVLGAVNRALPANGTMVCAAGGLPGELHKLWRATQPLNYHVEYGYSCMGYEIAGGLGVKLAHPRSPVAVLVGDGSYLMQNSEIASSVALGAPLVIVVLDNRGFGCIDRLSRATGSGTFNNLLEDRAPRVDFAAHAASLGAMARHVPDVAALEAALPAAFAARRTTVLVIATDPIATTQAGGAWWDVPVAATNTKLRRAYDRARAAQSRIN